jgi:polyisoprenoid-binding protein YceI
MSTTIEHSSLTRTVDGAEVPTPGTYALDESHTHIGFTARHLVVAKTRGSFASFRGALTVAEDPLASSVEVEIDIASVDSRDEKRDGHLLSADFFDVEQYPTMTYRSTAVRRGDKGRFVVDGELTVRDVTRPVDLVAEFDGAVSDPWGGTRVGFTAKAEVNREDFGLTWNQVLEGGGVVIGKTVTIEIEAELVLQ